MFKVSLQKHQRTNAVVLTLEGEFDLYEKDRVLMLLPEVLAHAPEQLVVDLSGITIFTSAGVEVLIVSYIQLKKAGIRMAVVVDHNNYLVRKFRNLGLFDGTGLEFFETVDEATRAACAG